MYMSFYFLYRHIHTWLYISFCKRSRPSPLLLPSFVVISLAAAGAHRAARHPRGEGREDEADRAREAARVMHEAQATWDSCRDREVDHYNLRLRNHEQGLGDHPGPRPEFEEMRRVSPMVDRNGLGVFPDLVAHNGPPIDHLARTATVRVARLRPMCACCCWCWPPALWPCVPDDRLAVRYGPPGPERPRVRSDPPWARPGASLQTRA